MNDFSFMRIVNSNIWLQDLDPKNSDIESFMNLYNTSSYDKITKTFFPTKTSTMQAINLSKIWNNSWWNPKNKGKFDAYRKSDVLFADMVCCGQGIYKIQRVTKNCENRKKIKQLFQETLTPFKKYFGQQYLNT